MQTNSIKSVLITGANDGIGFETAKQIADKGYRVLLHARNQTKAEEAVNRLGKQSVPVWGDLSKMSDVLNLTEMVKGHAPVLDVLINNAGVFENTLTITVDGFETTMGINHFSHALLILKLKDSLLAARQPRVVMVSGGVHIGAQLDFSDLNLTKGWSPMGSYAASKLANALFAAGLALQKDWEKVWTCSVHPGVIGTKTMHRVFGMGGAPVSMGAKTSVFCATVQGLESYRGGYFSDSMPAQGNGILYNKAKVQEFWEMTLKRLKKFG